MLPLQKEVVKHLPMFIPMMLVRLLSVHQLLNGETQKEVSNSYFKVERLSAVQYRRLKNILGDLKGH